MKKIYTRANTAFNLLALPFGIVVAIGYVFATGTVSGSWWEFLLTILLATYIFTLPFTLALRFVHEGGSERSRYLSITANLIFLTYGGYIFYHLFRGAQINGAGLFFLGFSPIAIFNAIYLMADSP